MRREVLGLGRIEKLHKHRYAHTNGKTAEVGHEHARGCEHGDFMCVARKRRVERTIGHIHKSIAHGQPHICNISISKRTREAVPETEYGETGQGDASEHKVSTVFAEARIMLVYERTYDRIPYHIDNAHYKEHHCRHGWVEAEHIGVEKQQIHADCLINQILGEVARAKADALQPRQLVKAVCFSVFHCFIH